MKKTLILGLILATLVLPIGGQVARAQVVGSSATIEQVDELKSTLIALLTQLIAQLQDQIATILAQQNHQQTQIDTIVHNVAPAPNTGGASTGSVVPTPTQTIDIIFYSGSSFLLSGSRLTFSATNSINSCGEYRITTDYPNGFFSGLNSGTTSDATLNLCGNNRYIEATTLGTYNLTASLVGSNLSVAKSFTVLDNPELNSVVDTRQTAYAQCMHQSPTPTNGSNQDSACHPQWIAITQLGNADSRQFVPNPNYGY